MQPDGPPVTPTQRAILLFARDTESADDVRALLTLADARPFHPSSDGPGRGVQRQWSDEEAQSYAWTLLQRLAGKLDWGATVLVPDKSQQE